MNQLTTKASLLFAFAITSLLSANVYAEVQTSVGDVYEAKSGELVYREFHTFSKPPATEFMQTEYKAVDGLLIADRRVNFSNGFATDYTFRQPNLNILKSVVRTGTEIKYSGTNGEKEIEKSFTPKNIDKTVVNAGMFNAVERNWESLIAGETVNIDLVVPDRGRAFAMKLKRVDANKSEMIKHQDIKGKVVFNLIISNRLFRLLLDPVELGYDMASRRLVFYYGPSNIKRSNGKKVGKIRINYQNS